MTVSTVAQLQAAENAARPGDQIRLAPGTYPVAFWTVNRDGTEEHPITLCGPRTAVVTPGSPNFINHTADWWVYRGFTLANGRSGIKTADGDHNVIDSLLIEHMESMAILLDLQSSGNIVRKNEIRHTGEVFPELGEGVYIGGGTPTDASDSNQVIGNLFGPNVRAEMVQIRGGARNLVKDNQGDATGFVFIPGVTRLLYWTGGNEDVFDGNTITNIASPSAAAMGTFHATGAVFRKNSVSGAFGLGYEIEDGAGNVLFCSNTAIGGPLSNISCTP